LHYYNLTDIKPDIADNELKSHLLENKIDQIIRNWPHSLEHVKEGSTVGTKTVSILIKPGIELDDLIKLNKGNIGDIYQLIKDNNVFIVKLFKDTHPDMIRDPPKNPFFIRIYKTKQIGNYHSQIMELCDGDIKSLKIKFELYHVLLFGLLLLKYNISHGDIKPSNFFIKDNVIKLADFDGSCDRSSASNFRYSTEYYLPNRRNCDTFSIDIYSLGLTCLESKNNYLSRTNSNYNSTLLGDFSDLIDQDPTKRLKCFHKLCLTLGNLVYDISNKLDKINY